MGMETDDLLRQAFDNSDMGCCVIKVILDENNKPCDWEFIYANEALAKIEGVSKEMLLSHSFFELFPNADKKWFKYYYPAAYENKSFEFVDISEEIGSALRIRCLPAVYGYCACILEDISREFENISDKTSNINVEDFYEYNVQNGYKKLVQQKILAALSCFDAFVGHFASSYYLNLVTGEFMVFRQDPVYSKYGMYGNWESFDRYISEMIHKADQEKLTECSRLSYIKERLSRESSYSVLIRDLGKKDQRYYLVHFMRGSDAEHAAIGFQDVTEQMEAEKELITIRDLVDAAKWSCELSPEGAVKKITFSENFRSLLGYEGEKEFPNSVDFLNSKIHPDDLEDCLARFYSSVKDTTGSTGFDTKYRMECKNGEYIWIRSAIRINRTQDGIATDVIGIILDIDDTYRKEERRIELEETQAALKNALLAAEQANKAKTVFLNSISHDIRTPMNAIMGFTALAASHVDNHNQVVDYLSKIHTAGTHLLSLINSVLDMSRIESGNMKIELKNVNFPELFHELRAIIQASISSKNLDLYIDTVDVVNENVLCDKLRLNQILLNLIGNSVKFTNPGGMISIRIIQKKCSIPEYAEYEFHVKDNGIGISKQYLEHIFEAFTREEKEEVRETQGSGLGMAITKNIVDLMGGTIRVESEEGKGTEFIINLTLKIVGEAEKLDAIPQLKGVRALVADDDSNTAVSVSEMLTKIGMRSDWTLSGKEAVLRTEVAVKQQDEYGVYIIDWLMPDLNGIETVRRIRRVIGDSQPIFLLTAYDWSDFEEEARQAGVTAFLSKPIFMSELQAALALPFKNVCESSNDQSQLAEDSADTISGKHILLAEDNEFNQEIAVELLQDAGFKVDVANDGLYALEMLENDADYKYDVVLMDVQMPRMNGYEATRKIRALSDSRKSNIPIIAMTANAFEEDKQQAFDAGMNAHLSKPVSVEVLLQVLKELL